MQINYLCISYVPFVDIFTRSFDDFISVKFLIAVFFPASPFQPPCLLTLEIFANLLVYCTLPVYYFIPKFARLPVCSALPPPPARFYLKLDSNTHLTSSSFSTKEHKGTILPKILVSLFLKMRYWYTMIKFVCSWNTSTQSPDIFK